MQSREEVLQYGLTFPDTYQDAPFRDNNWQLVRVRRNRKAFLWTYERNGYLCINIKVDPEWRDFWRDKYDSVLPGYHQNKEHWNTVILDGTVPEQEIKRMIAESYDLVTGNYFTNS
ncbi:MAG: MmcQ/YjbR family DNA-binding protein [Lachnospiraceae bacterium]|nr:MmcQ/YjbR family DNA-binding protein [Lachnospiraceae bacterium]